MENEFLQDQSRKIPKFFQQCLGYLEDQALHIAGIFRISGTTKRIKSLKDDVDTGKELSFNDVKPHDVTGLLKMFFREMPEPLLTFKLYEFYISAASTLL
jgi:DNA-binding protein Fis